jgi:hypothetical protein
MLGGKCLLGGVGRTAGHQPPRIKRRTMKMLDRSELSEVREFILLSHSLVRFVLTFASHPFHSLVIEDGIEAVKLLLHIVGVSLDALGRGGIPVLEIGID